MLLVQCVVYGVFRWPIGYGWCCGKGLVMVDAIGLKYGLMRLQVALVGLMNAVQKAVSL